ncbi:MAG: tetratricopeptide repeat protein [candidate division KSB1 bacterium]|nr:tetratricopeptide repeat protein [candidate division KSB1 bacterium]MDZ7342740.1 tetratricopeptide repeat protein [candidate division KSB1 bacterium]
MNQQRVDLQRDVIDASFKQPIVLDFWAEWCAPCRMLGPVLENLAKAAGDRWKLVKINTELQPELAMQFGVQSIPAVKMVADGAIIAEFVGALPAAQVSRWLEENLPTKSKNAVQQAIQALESGDVRRSKYLLQMALDEDPKNNDAKIILARLKFDENIEAAMKLVEDVEPPHPMFDQVEAIRNLHRLQSNFHELKKKAVHNSEAWSLYLAGIEAIKRRDYDAALNSWIESIMLDRSVDDDGARKGCVALFLLLGSEHQLTQKYHRRFSSALF